MKELEHGKGCNFKTENLDNSKLDQTSQVSAKNHFPESKGGTWCRRTRRHPQVVIVDFIIHNCMRAFMKFAVARIL